MPLAPYLPRSTRCLVSSMVGSSWNSSMTTSGAPLPAFNAVCSLVYSSPPVPARVQSILTSEWVALNRSTTGWNAGYHAHTLMCTGPDDELSDDDEHAPVAAARARTARRDQVR